MSPSSKLFTENSQTTTTKLIFVNPTKHFTLTTSTWPLLGGRLENLDWFENGDDDEDSKVFARYNDSERFRPSDNTMKQIILEPGGMSVLMSRLFVKTNKYRKGLYGVQPDVFSNPVEIICERGKSITT